MNSQELTELLTDPDAVAAIEEAMAVNRINRERDNNSPQWSSLMASYTTARSHGFSQGPTIALPTNRRGQIDISFRMDHVQAISREPQSRTFLVPDAWVTKLATAYAAWEAAQREADQGTHPTLHRAVQDFATRTNATADQVLTALSAVGTQVGTNTAPIANFVVVEEQRSGS